MRLRGGMSAMTFIDSCGHVLMFYIMMHNGSAVTLFGTIFVDDIEQNHAVLVY